LFGNPIINPLITLVPNILKKKTKEVGSNSGVKGLNYNLLFIIKQRPITLMHTKVDLTIIQQFKVVGWSAVNVMYYIYIVNSLMEQFSHKKKPF
jgi:hypothetical protein